MNKSINELRYDLAMASAVVTVLFDISSGRIPETSISESVMESFKSNYGSICLKGTSSLVDLKHDIDNLEHTIVEAKPRRV